MSLWAVQSGTSDPKGPRIKFQVANRTRASPEHGSFRQQLVLKLNAGALPVPPQLAGELAPVCRKAADFTTDDMILAKVGKKAVAMA
jgi:hypothetical protein